MSFFVKVSFKKPYLGTDGFSGLFGGGGFGRDGIDGLPPEGCGGGAGREAGGGLFRRKKIRCKNNVVRCVN